MVTFIQRAKRGGTLGGLLAGLVIGGLAGALVADRLAREWTAPVEPAPPAGAASRAAEPDSLADKLRDWHLAPDDLRRELAQAGRIVREKSRVLGTKVAETASDVTIMAKIKAKYVLDERLDALAIIVGCKDGHVTLSGRVPDTAMVGRAIALALDTHGVVDVVSSIRVELAESSGGAM